MLQDLARRVGLASERADEVGVPYELPDRATLERALLAFAPILRIGPEVAEQVIRRTVRRMPSRSGDPTARTGSRTGSGI